MPVTNQVINLFFNNYISCFFSPYIIIIALYSIIVLIILKRMDFKKIEWRVFKKISILSIFLSLIITYIVINYYKISFLDIESQFLILLIFSFIISIPLYIVICRNGFNWNPIIFSIAFATLLSGAFMPSIINMIDEQKLNETFEENVKCAIYIDNHKIEWNSKYTPYKYKFQIIPFIINNGNKNIDKDLQITIDCSANEKFIFESPDGNMNISYFSE